jgi:hypothetical protein
MSQARRDSAEDVRRHEREIQIEEVTATLEQLKAKEDEFCARDDVIPSASFELEPGPEPKPPPKSLNISKDDVNFDKCSFPCYVMNHTKLCRLQYLPSHEYAYQHRLLERLTMTSQASTRYPVCKFQIPKFDTSLIKNGMWTFDREQTTRVALPFIRATKPSYQRADSELHA